MTPPVTWRKHNLFRHLQSQPIFPQKTPGRAGHIFARCYNPARFRGETKRPTDFQPEIQPDARIAQLVEQRIENPRVGGSNPPPGTINFLKEINDLPRSYR